MIIQRFATALAIVLLALSAASCAQHSRSGGSGSSAATGSSAAGTSGPSGAAEMGRGRCEALTGPERQKCLADDRVSPAESKAKQ